MLLVKRFKRLPPGSDRHWGHVVDARVGPGLKSMTKFKKRKDDVKDIKESVSKSKLNGNDSGNQTKSEKSGISSVPERFCKIFRKTKKKPNGTTNGTSSIKLNKQTHKKEIDTSGSDDDSSPNSPMSSISDGESSNGVPDTDMKISTKFKRKNYHPFKNKRKIDEVQPLDTQNWKKKMTCCGLIYENPIISAVIIDISMHEPCKEHLPSDVKRCNIKNKKTEGLVGELEHELIGNCNTDDLLIKLTDEQIQENIENASHTGFNKISKVSDLFNTNTTAFKKHHLYSKRGGNVLIPTNGSNTVEEKKNNSIIAKKTEIHSNGTSVVAQPLSKLINEDPEMINDTKDSFHKVKPEFGGKITKPTNPAKLSALKVKPLDFNVKNLVKLCAERNLHNTGAPETGNNGMENGNKCVTGKFMSDNSSDSGYEETQEAQVHIVCFLNLYKIIHLFFNI